MRIGFWGRGAEDLNARERIAYLRGLLDCMEPEERNTKVYTAVAEALDVSNIHTAKCNFALLHIIKS